MFNTLDFVVSHNSRRIIISVAICFDCDIFVNNIKDMIANEGQCLIANKR